jgi:hypothetical protein
MRILSSLLSQLYLGELICGVSSIQSGIARRPPACCFCFNYLVMEVDYGLGGIDFGLVGTDVVQFGIGHGLADIGSDMVWSLAPKDVD